MRLIDADAFIKFLKETSKKLEFDKIEFKDSSLTAQAIIDGVIADLDGTSLDGFENAPTIEPEPKWTPVTEALPEEEKNVLATVHFDGFKNAYTNIPPSDYVDIASQYEGYWSSPSDEYKVAESRHHVIAWKPLPEPWRGE